MCGCRRLLSTTAAARSRDGHCDICRRRSHRLTIVNDIHFVKRGCCINTSRYRPMPERSMRHGSDAVRPVSGQPRGHQRHDHRVQGQLHGSVRRPRQDRRVLPRPGRQWRHGSGPAGGEFLDRDPQSAGRTGRHLRLHGATERGERLHGVHRSRHRGCADARRRLSRTAAAAAPLQTLAGIGDQVPGEAPGTGFNALGEGLSLSSDARFVTFWAAWGTETFARRRSTVPPTATRTCSRSATRRTRRATRWRFPCTRASSGGRGDREGYSHRQDASRRLHRFPVLGLLGPSARNRRRRRADTRAGEVAFVHVHRAVGRTGRRAADRIQGHQGHVRRHLPPAGTQQRRRGS